jgi:hypothetical protein
VTISLVVDRTSFLSMTLRLGRHDVLFDLVIDLKPFCLFEYSRERQRRTTGGTMNLQVRSRSFRPDPAAINVIGPALIRPV